MNKKSILIIGGVGFVGSNLAHKLLQDYNVSKITLIDNLISSDAINIPKSNKVKFIYGSISDDMIVLNLRDEYDYIFHLSCYHGNQSSIINPIEDHQNNTLTSLKLFEKIKDFKKLKKVVYAAAGCAVAEKTYEKASATKEEAPVSLYHDSPYSISKIIGELYGNYFFKQHGLPFVKARFQNIYGPREILGAGIWRGTPNTIWRNVVPTFIWKALNNESIDLYAGGETSRDFIFVDDIAKGLISCALYGENGEAYNLASGKETSILDLVKMIKELTKSKSKLNILPKREWDNSGKRYGSTIKSKKELKFETETNLKEGLIKTINWTIENASFIENKINSHRYFIENQ